MKFDWPLFSILGINVQNTDEHNEYDSVEERYQKVKF